MPHPDSPIANPLPVLAVAAAVFSFSAGPVGLVVQKYLVVSYAPPLIIAVQMTVGALLLWIVRPAFPAATVSSPVLLLGLALGAVQPGILMIVLTTAGARLDSVTFVLLTALMPGAVALCGRMILKERLSIWVMAGLSVSFAGMIVLVVARDATGANAPLGFVLAGLGLVIGAGGITAGRALNRAALLPWYLLAPLQVSGAALAAWIGVMVWALGPGSDAGLADAPLLDPEAVLAFAYLALGMTALSYLSYNFALSRLSAVHIGLLSAAGPAVGTLAAALIFQQTLDWPALAGVGVVLFGAALPALSGLSRRRQEAVP